jgi:hypothetical protein
MILTVNYAALNILFDLNILNMNNTDIIYGSDFPDDKSNFKISLDVNFLI